MNQKITDQKIEEVTQKIVKKFQPEKIILFGSWARGDADSDSDVDLFIVRNSNKPRRERQRDLRMKLFPPRMPLDLLVYTPKEVDERLKIGDFFIRDIINKGKVLYASES